MSRPPPPPQYSGGPYPPPAHPKPRPRKRWFFVGGALLALSIVALVIGAVLTFSSVTETDAVVDATATPVEVEVEPGEERMFFVPEEQPPVRCQLRDTDGDAIALYPPSGTVTVTAQGRTWLGVGTFTSTGPDVVVECDGTAGQVVRIGAAFGFDTVGRLLLAMAVPVGLGLVGATILLVTTILWVSRKPAPPMTHPGYGGPPPPR